MTNKEVIRYLEICKKYIDKIRVSEGVEVSKEVYVALDTAIKSLEQAPIDGELEKELIKGHCKCCKHFEYDVVAMVDGIPLIVGHEMCNKWGNGCKTKEDGYCFLFEPIET